MEIEDLNREEVVNIEIPTGRPIMYKFDSTMKMIEKRKL